MIAIEEKAVKSLIEACNKVPEYLADRYGLSEPLRILRDPEEAARIAAFFSSQFDFEAAPQPFTACTAEPTDAHLKVCPICQRENELARGE